jgi:hypothetical protein
MEMLVTKFQEGNPPFALTIAGLTVVAEPMRDNAEGGS